uniref:Uncharacterized protein n=1 Tax=Candidatus Methanophaga sp. ANME-1 ERB7 TaxID=2759913 RepID=A0A7G9ZBM7_9EURY|nr:hypothetical protein KDLDOCHL_00003 [Methanosarcinales archaeon ANME-1 ERB7]
MMLGGAVSRVTVKVVLLLFSSCIFPTETVPEKMLNTNTNAKINEKLLVASFFFPDSRFCFIFYHPRFGV